MDVLRGIFPTVNRTDLGCICVILWSIWWNRNLAIHKGNPKNAADLVVWALDFLSDFQGTQQAMASGVMISKAPPKTGGVLLLALLN